MPADVGEKEVVSAVLLPNERDTKVLIDVSQTINTEIKSGIVLSDVSLPHITLVQFFAPEHEAGNLWRNIQHLQGRATEAISTGLLFLPEAARNNTWLEMSFFLSHALIDLRDAVLATPFAKKFEANNGNPDRFRPHVTLAMYPGRQALALDLAQLSIFRKTYPGLRLAVGVNGPNLSLIKVVAE